MNNVKAKSVKGFMVGEGVCGRWRGLWQMKGC